MNNGLCSSHFPYQSPAAGMAFRGDGRCDNPCAGAGVGAGKAGSGVTLTQLSHSGVCCRPVLVRISSVNSFGVISSSSLV